MSLPRNTKRWCHSSRHTRHCCSGRCTCHEHRVLCRRRVVCADSARRRSHRCVSFQRRSFRLRVSHIIMIPLASQHIAMVIYCLGSIGTSGVTRPKQNVAAMLITDDVTALTTLTILLASPSEPRECSSLASRLCPPHKTRRDARRVAHWTVTHWTVTNRTVTHRTVTHRTVTHQRNEKAKSCSPLRKFEFHFKTQHMSFTESPLGVVADL